jgi:hypothetical protein
LVHYPHALHLDRTWLFRRRATRAHHDREALLVFFGRHLARSILRTQRNALFLLGDEMSDRTVEFSRARHPAPERQDVSLSALFFGLFAAPIVWAGNLMVTFAINVHACFPGADPLGRAIQGFGFAWWFILACYLAALVLCAIAFFVSYRNWEASGSESEGHVHHLMERGEGRTRYLSLIGMSFNVLFFVAVLYGAIIMAIEPLCAY